MEESTDRRTLRSSKGMTVGSSSKSTVTSRPSEVVQGAGAATIGMWSSMVSVKHVYAVRWEYVQPPPEVLLPSTTSCSMPRGW